VSNSGRIVLEPDDWVVGYALSLAGVSPVPERFSVSFHVVPRHVDRFTPPPPAGPGIERVVTLAQGLVNGEHELSLQGALASVRAIRVYQPPLAARSTTQRPAPERASTRPVEQSVPSAE
jgi:hypothetical protein